MPKMRFAVRLPVGHLLWEERCGHLLPENRRLMKQLGCTEVIGTAPRLRPESEVWEYADIMLDKMQVERDGLRLEVIEGAPKAEKIFWNLPGRDEQLDNFCRSLKNLGNAGIKVITAEYMLPLPNMIWRTNWNKLTRGEAITHGFDYDDVKNAPPTSKYGTYTEEDVWENIAYFLKGTLPTAEKAGVVIAFHPSDPPISPIQGIPRPLRSVEAFDRLLEIVPSDNIGLSFCQGCFAEMGVDVPTAIRHFGKRKKIFFAHFRNIMGTVKEPGGFHEVFHDDPTGRIDMFEAMKAYYEVGFEGPMRPDHAPRMEGDGRLGNSFSGSSSHYRNSVLGKVLAIGYMKGLAESIEKIGY